MKLHRKNIEGRQMQQRNSRFPLAFSAAALVCLAGTSAGYAQFSFQGGEQPGSQPGDQPGDDQIRDPMGGGQDQSGTQGVTVDENLIVDIHVNDEDLANVLQMLSIQSQRNIIASKNVSAVVTANLYGVTFYEALDAILNVNGFGYMEQGNFIYIYTGEELEQIQQQMLQRETKVIFLEYLNATDAAEFARPLLSADGGAITTNGRAPDFNIPDNATVGNNDYASEAMLVVHDYPENIEAIVKLIDEIDTRPAQVLVEATILQAELNEFNAFGIDFSIVGSLDFNDFVGIGGPLQVANGLISGAGQTVAGTDVSIPGDEFGVAGGTSIANLSGPSTMKAGIVAGDMAIFLRALDEVTDTTILSRPTLLTLNRQPARVLVGRKVGYLSTTATQTSTTQTVEFLDTGTQLYFRPFVSKDGIIRMELKPQVSEAVIRNATDATGAAVTIPDEITNEITTNIMVPDGQTVVLGGLFRESTQATRRQVPLLGDLPIIGQIFRGHDDESRRNEIIFMVTPTIVSDAMISAQAMAASDFVETTRFGARQGLLIFSRERQVGQLLIEAEALAAAGKDKQALSKVQRALALHPQSSSARSLKEDLLKKKEIWPSNSGLSRIISSVAEDKVDAWDDGSNTFIDLGAGLTSADDNDQGWSFQEPVADDQGNDNGSWDNNVPTEPVENDDNFNQLKNDQDDPWQPEPQANGVSANGDGTFDVSFHDSDIGDVLREFGIAARQNIVRSNAVTGNVTINMFSVSLFEAFDALLPVNGWGYRHENKIVFIYTAQELAVIDAEAAALAAAGEDVDDAADEPVGPWNWSQQNQQADAQQDQADEPQAVADNSDNNSDGTNEPVGPWNWSQFGQNQQADSKQGQADESTIVADNSGNVIDGPVGPWKPAAWDEGANDVAQANRGLGNGQTGLSFANMWSFLEYLNESGEQAFSEVPTDDSND